MLHGVGLHMVTDISGQNSSQAIQDILAYHTALWNTSYVLSSIKQDMPCKAKKDTTHTHLIPITKKWENQKKWPSL